MVDEIMSTNLESDRLSQEAEAKYGFRPPPVYEQRISELVDRCWDLRTDLAQTPATTLADTFDKVAAYWKAHNAPDAVMFAENARDAARAIADGTGDKAANTMKLQAQCGGCHMAHREGAAPNFKIK